jgi:hypothetical protein
MPLPMMIGPRNAEFEFSSVTRNGGSDAIENAYTVANKTGRRRTGTLVHHR